MGIVFKIKIAYISLLALLGEALFLTWIKCQLSNWCAWLCTCLPTIYPLYCDHSELSTRWIQKRNLPVDTGLVVSHTSLVFLILLSLVLGKFSVVCGTCSGLASSTDFFHYGLWIWLYPPTKSSLHVSRCTGTACVLEHYGP